VAYEGRSLPRRHDSYGCHAGIGRLRYVHVDHVGWNTKLVDGRWVPTFPNAQYLFHETKYSDRPEGAGNARREAFEESVLPAVDAGQAVIVTDGHRIDDAIHVVFSPGHTPGHSFLHLNESDGRAIFTGNCMHHPIQIAYPEWNSRYCFYPSQPAKTQQDIVERCADTDTVVLAAHFADPVTARVVSISERWKLDLDVN
jgi:glyoxylase-like metal-dependent hydrolase (beta-lactamase superfamily II)